MSGLLRDGLLVGLGGFFGAVARFLVTGWLQALGGRLTVPP